MKTATIIALIIATLVTGNGAATKAVKIHNVKNDTTEIG